MTWRFWWLHGRLAEFAQRTKSWPVARPAAYQRRGADRRRILLANGIWPAGDVFSRACRLPATSEKLGLVLNATVLAVLGHLAAARHDYAALLGDGQAMVQEFRDEDLTGYDHLQLLLTVAFVDNFLGQVRLSQADNDAAARLFTDGLSVARRAQDEIPILISLYDLALSSQAQGDLVGAAGNLKEGLAIAAEAGDETSAAYYFEALAAVASQQDNPHRAVRLLFAARSQLEASGSGWLHACVPRAPHDDAVLAALRARIGDAAYQEARAWADPSEAGTPDSTH